MLILAGLLYHFTLEGPYHYDTAVYMKTVQTFKETGTLACYFSTRCVTSYTFIPLSLVLGDRTLPATIVLATLVSLFFYYLWIRRITNHDVALLSAFLLLVIPSSLMTITHGKEDFISLACLMPAFYLAGSQKPVRYLSGVLFGLALLTKETVMLFVPFYVAYIYLSSAQVKEGWAEILGVKTFLKGLREACCMAGAAAVVVVAINPGYMAAAFNLTGSPYVGQVKGLFSPLLPLGIEWWKYGTGRFLFFFQFAGFITLFTEKDPARRLVYLLFTLQFLFLFFFLCNNTTHHYRHFLWTSMLSFPLLILALYRMATALPLGSRAGRAVPYLAVGIAGGVLLVLTMPAIEFHGRYNPQARFYGMEVDRDRSLFLGMDSCALARHYSKAPCLDHPVDPSAQEAGAFFEKTLAYMQKGYKVYVIPDFLSYDKDHHLARAFDGFVFRTVQEGWIEDFHAMSYGYTLEEFGDVLKREAKEGDCRNAHTTSVDAGPTGRERLDPKAGDSLMVDSYLFVLRCDGLVRKFAVRAVNGRVYPELKRGLIVEIVRAL